jgi:hypothetical protein
VVLEEQGGDPRVTLQRGNASVSGIGFLSN